MSFLRDLGVLILTVLTYLMILPVSPVAAQSNATAKLSYGGRMAISKGNLVGGESRYGTFGTKIGTEFGGVFLWRAGHNVHLQLELNYRASKWKRKRNELLLNENTTFIEEGTLTSISIPCLIKLPFPSRSASTFSVYGGVSFEIVVSGKIDGEVVSLVGSPITDQTYNLDIGNYRDGNGSLIAGFGYEMPLGNTLKLVLDLRFNRSMTNSFNNIAGLDYFYKDEVQYADLFTGQQYELQPASISFSVTILH